MSGKEPLNLESEMEGESRERPGGETENSGLARTGREDRLVEKQLACRVCGAQGAF